MKLTAMKIITEKMTIIKKKMILWKFAEKIKSIMLI